MTRLFKITCFLTPLMFLSLAAPAVGWAAEDAAGHPAPGVREDLSLWGLVAFVLFVFTCFKLLGDWAGRSLAEREQTEQALIAEAEEKNRQVQELLTERRGQMEAIGEEIDERIAEAHRDAEHTRGDIVSVARREAGVLQNRAHSEINRTRNQALNDLFSTMAARVVAKTEENIKQRLNTAEHDRLIDEALTHFARS
jgi:F-type H+-transporting ATPase subunit b